MELRLVCKSIVDQSNVVQRNRGHRTKPALPRQQAVERQSHNRLCGRLQVSRLQVPIESRQKERSASILWRETGIRHKPLELLRAEAPGHDPQKFERSGPVQGQPRHGELLVSGGPAEPLENHSRGIGEQVLCRVQSLRRIRPSVAVHLGHPHRVRQDGNGPDISGRKVSLRPIEDASIQVDGDPVAVIGDENAVLQAVNLQKGPGHSPNLHPQRRAPWAFKPHGRTIHLVPCDRGAGWERQFSVRDFIISLRLSGNIMDGRPGHQKPILYALHPAGLDHTGNGGCLIGNGKIHPSRIRLHAILRLADAPDGVGLPSEKTVIGKLDVFCTIDISGIP